MNVQVIRKHWLLDWPCADSASARFQYSQTALPTTGSQAYTFVRLAILRTTFNKIAPRTSSSFVSVCDNAIIDTFTNMQRYSNLARLHALLLNRSSWGANAHSLVLNLHYAVSTLLNYCALVWLNSSQVKKVNLQINRAIRII